MSIGRSLPVIQVEPSRRRVLLLGIASVGVACGPAARPGTYDASPGDLDATASAAEVSVAPRDVVADEPDASGGDARSPDAPGPDARVLDVAADEGGEPDASAADVGAPGEDRPDAPPPGDLAALDAPACPADAVRLGALTEFPLGTWQLVLPNALIVGHDEAGLFVFSARCTHRGCVVDRPDARGVSVCGCHGSSFDGHGAVLAGPAVTPMQHYELLRCGDDLHVTAREVGSAARLRR
jgi:Rieske Fe-S protein